MSPLYILLTSIAFFAILYILINFPKNIIRALMLIAFFLPFERIPTLELGGLTLKINHLLIAGVIFFWIFNKIYSSNRKFNYNPIAINILFLIGAIILSAVFAVFKDRAIMFSAMSIFIILIAVVIIDQIRNFHQYQKLEKALTISTWIVIIFSFWQFAGDMVGLPLSLTGLIEGYSKSVFGFPRVQAFSKEPLYLGNLLLLPLGMVVGRMIAKKEYAFDKLLLFLLILVIFMTLSRGAILGLFVFLLVLALVSPKRVLTYKNILLTLISLSVAFGLFYGVISSLGSNIKDKFVEHLTLQNYQQSESSVSRLSWAQVALDAWRTSPIVGIGMGNFGGFQVDFDKTSPRTSDIVNNEYLELLSENGILGLFFFLSIIISLIVRSYKIIVSKSASINNGFIIGLTAGFIGMMAQYNFFSTLSIIHIWFAIGILAAVQNIALQNEVNSK